jgi:paraquat-inducible protein B
MAKEANKSLIGAFVVVAIALAVAAILVFGGGRFFTESILLVAYFEGSVKGLGIGSEVQMKGVTVGEVKDVKLLFNPNSLDFINRVLIEIEPGRVGSYFDPTDRQSFEESDADPEEFIDSLINRGLRAKLTLDSVVTGKLLMAFDFYPETRAQLRDLEPDIIEVPTVQTDFEKIAKALSELPLEDMVFRVSDTLQGINAIIRSPELKQALHALNQTLQNTEKLVENVDSRIEPLAQRIDETLQGYGRLARNINNQVKPLAASVKNTAGDAQKLVRNLDNRLKKAMIKAENAIEQAESTLRTIEVFAEEDSYFQKDLADALKEVEGAARSIRQLADYLVRHPEALLRGKTGSGGR